MATRTCFLLINLLAVSCASDNQQLVGAAPPEKIVAGPKRSDHITIEKPAVERPTNNPEALVIIDGWPFQETGRRLTLTWNGGDDALPLLDIPSLNGLPVAEAVFQRGEVIHWTQSNVGIYRPSIYRAKKPVGVEGFSHGAAYRTGDEAFYAELKTGEQVFLYHYLGNGQCLMQVHNEMVEATCPTKEHFSGNFEGADDALRFQPAERIWWIFLGSAGKGGWMIVDDRVIVDIE